MTKEPTQKVGAVEFSSPGDTTEAEHLDKLLDEALLETFPASDPIAIAIERDIRNRHDSAPTAASARAIS